MAKRRTRVTVSIEWDDEDNDHPAQWDFSNLLGLESDEAAIVVDFMDLVGDEPWERVAHIDKDELAHITNARLMPFTRCGERVRGRPQLSTRPPCPICFRIKHQIRDPN